MTATGERQESLEFQMGDLWVRRHRKDIPLIFDKHAPGAQEYRLPPLDVPAREVETLLPAGALRRRPAGLPEVGEPEVVRHFIELSTFNHHVDKALYPLGSCTMKYNPKINEELAGRPGLAGLHPLAPQDHIQGMLELLHRFGRELAEIVGMDEVSLHPAAGAQGEFLGIKLVRAYHESRGNAKSVILIPDSAHGTNPATVRMVGYEVQELRSRADGRLDLSRLREQITPQTAGIMVTNPNTVGLFESDFQEMAEMIHAVDGLVYMDGANLNALMGLVRPGDIGADIVHINLHKTFSTPHGGGGPGAGPVGVKRALVPFLPLPRIVHDGGRYVVESDDRRATGSDDRRAVGSDNHRAVGADERRATGPNGPRATESRGSRAPLSDRSIGRLHPYHGNIGVILRAFAYLRSLGSDHLADVSRGAILNANYLAKKVESDYPAAHPGPFLHEFVTSLSWMKKHGVRNIDAAKRLLDDGFHAPTVSFPLIVPDCFMIEPTETETLASIDAFAASLLRIAEEVRTQPELVTTAPHWTPVGRLDEAGAARTLKLRWEWTE